MTFFYAVTRQTIRPKRKENRANLRAKALDCFADIVIGGKSYVVS